MVSGMCGLGGPNVHALMVACGLQGHKHEPVQPPGLLTAVKYVEEQANAHSHVNRLLNVQGTVLLQHLRKM